MTRYPNKRLMFRTAHGRFRPAKMEDVGISGICPACGHLMLRYYDGDEHDPNPDPRKFRSRCFTCEPLLGQQEVKP